MPSGSVFHFEATRKNKDEILRCLGDFTQEILSRIQDARALPCAELLLLGASMVAPNEAVEKPSFGFQTRAKMRIQEVLRGNFDATVILANKLLLEMSTKPTQYQRKRAEADYTALIKAGLERGVLIPLLQRAYNARKKLMAMPSQ